MSTLAISVVTYAPERAQIHSLLESLTAAAQHAIDRKVVESVNLFLVDNGPSAASLPLLQDIAQGVDAGVLSTKILSGHGNLGYGAGNNLALAQAGEAAFFLISNPDVVLAADALTQGLDYLRRHPETALLAPAVIADDGSAGHLCKAYPSVLDLLLRGFAPARLQDAFAARLGRYRLAALEPAGGPRPIPIASGSFMLCRTASLQEIDGFDPGYFLYFEDFDLSLRLSRVGRLLWLPSMRIRHAGGRASRKGLRHLWLFAQSATRFFNRHGWRLW